MHDKGFASVWIESEGERWEHARVRRLSGKEAIGQLFSFDVDIVCEPHRDVPPSAKTGAEVALVFERDGEEIRRIHGVLAAIRSRLGASGDTPSYGLRVVPRASRLALVETQEIFLGKSVPEVIRGKLERHGFDARDFDLRLMGKYPARELVVQYAESDLAFVSRLAEHLGISFFFEHDDGRDRMIFTDHPHGFDEGPADLSFSPAQKGDHVFALDRVTETAPTSFIVQDYNYRTPLVDLTACADLGDGNGGGVVEYGSHVKTPDEAEQIARARADERRSRQTVVEGESGVMTLSAGRRVTIADVPPSHASEALLVVEVRHEATFPAFDETAERARYTNALRAVPQGFTYRPPRRTPRPVVPGMVTGVIQLGPNGEKGGVAQIDAEGRYWVELHFDTAQPGAQRASHPIRMAQPFAGPSYGMHFPLRRGTEVLVTFVNGDPDRPVIVGALYNATSPSPVVASNANTHQLKASSGISIEFGSRS